ncbi:MAG: ATP-binding cassette domain-containing protein [Sandaracinaceae bacterium]|nr:ATP-binding cassette domain-containing protein [Sandaracinaceae bacterium]
MTARVEGAHPARPRLDVALRFDAGVTAIVGPSGAGKSTLLAAIAGLVRPSSGRIVLDGLPLFDAGPRVFVPAHRRRVALVFQSLALFPHLCAWQNVAYGIDAPRRARRERALSWLARTRAEALAERLPATLSGGEAQRVALARALASEPRALLLDEPFSALDPALREALGDDVRALVTELSIPALLVTHHREDAARLGARLVALSGGRLVDPIARPW